MKTRCHSLFLACVLAVAALAGPVWAERADRNKPMNIEADALRYDDVKQVSVFTGKVVITKGTIVIRGARVEVRQDAQGNQFGTVTAEPGKLAFFRQKREGVDEFIEGEGELIEYDSKADVVRFNRRAELRRYRGATLSDELTGNLIVYDNGTDVFTVNGAVTQPGAPAASDGRIRAILNPRGAASAPTSAASGPAPALRPSVTLGGDRK
jgi:lipopolysaccharide export system protein LptA